MKLLSHLAFGSLWLIAACAGVQDDDRTPATQPRSLSPDPPSATQPDPNVVPPERPPPEPEPIAPATTGGMIPMADAGPGGTGGRGGTGGVGGTGGAGGTGGGKPF